MSFLGAFFLWAGLAAAIPLVIHLLSKKKKVVLPWGAMQFLFEKAPRKKARFRKFNELLILLLRILAIMLLALAFARPLAQFFGSGEPRRDLILILDTSLSSSLEHPEGQSVFQHHQERAAEAIQSLSDGDYLRILVGANHPHWLISTPTMMTPENRETIVTEIRKLKPGLAAVKMEELILEASAQPPVKKGLLKEITLLTDETTHGWDLDENYHWSASPSSQQSFDSPTSFQVFMSQVQLRKQANLSVEEVSLSQQVTAPGTTVTALATIRNRSGYPSKYSQVVWKLGRETIANQDLHPLSPDEATTLSLEIIAPSQGTFPLSCHLEADDLLPPDNTGGTVLEVVTDLPFLIVDDSTDFFESGFLRTALGSPPSSKKKRSSTFKPTLVTSDELALESLQNYLAVILVNPASIGPSQEKQLTEFVSGGGGLWITLGDRASKSSFPFLPASLASPISFSSKEDEVAVRPPLNESSPLRLLGDLDRLDTDRVRLSSHHQFEETLPSEAEIYLTIENGKPLVVGSYLGTGQIITSTIPLSRAWSNFPLTRAYVVMVHELMRHLIAPQMTDRDLSAGVPFQWQPTSAIAGEQVSLEYLAGQVPETQSSHQLSDNALLITAPAQPGLYRVTSPRLTKENLVQYFSVSRDPRESQITLLTDIEKGKLGASGLLEWTDELFSTPAAQSTAKASGQPMWPLLFAAILLAFLSELFLTQRLLAQKSQKHQVATPLPL